MKNKKNDYKNPINRTEANPFEIQKESSKYYSASYLSPARFSSLSFQYSLALGTNCITYVNIGSGNSLLSYLLKKQEKFVIDFDLDSHTHPSVVGVFPYLPFRTDSFEVALCFQVLEHLPFSLFQTSLKELKRVARKFIIISLPDKSISLREKIKMNIYHNIKHPREWKQYRMRTIDKEHFWELSNEGIKTSIIDNIIKAEGLVNMTHFRNYLYPYHHFFLIKKDGAINP